MANSISYKVPNLALSGKGKGWVAECHKPCVAGDTTCATYLKAPFPDLNTYELESGKIYCVNEPCRMPVVDDDDVFGVGEQSFTSRRYYLFVHPDGHTQEITQGDANRRLRNQQTGLPTVKTVPQPRSEESSFTVTALVEPNRVVFTNANGKSVSLTLSVDTAKKLQQLGGDHGEL